MTTGYHVIGGSSLTGMVCRTSLLGILLLQLHAFLVHPLLLLQFTTYGLCLHAATQALDIPVTPQQGNGGNGNNVEQHGPTGAPEGRTDGNIHASLLVANGAIVVEHAHTQGV